ncbi:acyl carrier protein [Saccharomonospora glauca]|jgi:minimal PKS acyl carrier protein|uniref:Phosphopantetheine-containing protein n=1 Tax=Saccharomonospora glauca K62 TaxID=928724 RepID=I1D270_9PSEU|nr:acyl carrier protein [Saccharomonospora glauca]EIE99044.1 phosphopantetheine-containing protein [Saccharomonospora glauca K62]
MSDPDISMEELGELLSSSSGVRVDTAELTAATTFDDLGLDSLAVLGVITAIERNRGVVLPPEAQETRSVREFLTILNDTLRKAA